MTIGEITALRIQLWHNGWTPLPITSPNYAHPKVLSPGKQPFFKAWQKISSDTLTEDTIRSWEAIRDHHNTGLKCGSLLGLDIDVPVADLATKIEKLADALLGSSHLVRIGAAPKSVRCYRHETPLGKQQTPELFLPDGTKCKIEAMGNGQQVVGFGIHPDTHQPYRWLNGSPLNTLFAEVPGVSQTALAEFMAAAEALLRAAGARTRKEIENAEKAGKPSAGNGTQRKQAKQDGSPFFRQVNTAALADIAAWVKRLFPSAEHQPDTGAWRVTSQALGRSLQEDISLHPDGIQDFGTERAMTPIDVVIEHGGAPDAVKAAFALCEWLGRKPADFGWRESQAAADDEAEAEPAGRSATDEIGDAPAEPFTPGWRGPPDDDLAVFQDSKGNIFANSQSNIRSAIAGCGVRLTYDEFADRELIEGPHGKPGRPYNDAEENSLYLYIDQKYHFLPTAEFFRLVAGDLARRHTFHPVRQYLAHVAPKWDHIPRIGQASRITEDGEVLRGAPSWLTTYGGAPDTDHTRAVGRMLLVAAARRVRKPGTKFDEIVTFVTPKQGQNRSTAIEIMAVFPEWYTDSIPIGADDKVIIEQTSGVWIVELADLHGKRRDVNAIKNFASRHSDRARLAYGHKREERPRPFIMIGTTNEQAPLRDSTGNRRFPMIRIISFDINALRRDRDQLWAEAATLEAIGESIRLDPALYDTAAMVQEAHRHRDTWEELLSDLLDDKVGKVATEELWAAVGKEDPGKRIQDDNHQISNAMQALGWHATRRRFDGLLRYCYVKGTRDDMETITITTIHPKKHHHHG